jgi:hypothetical protein
MKSLNISPRKNNPAIATKNKETKIADVNFKSSQKILKNVRIGFFL